MNCYYDMSEQQKQLYIAQNLIENENLYTLSFTMTFEGRLDRLCLYKAIQKVFDRNEILKSRIKEDGDTVKLMINNDEVKVEFIEDTIVNTNNYEIAENIDLKYDTLYKIKLIKNKDDVHILYFSFHHIIIDGDSIKLFCESLRKSYNEEINKKFETDNNSSLKQSRSLNYFDYISYQGIFRKSVYYRQQIDYLQSQFEDQYDFLSLPINKTTAIHSLYDSNAESVSLDPNTFNDLQKYALANKIQVNSIFLTGLTLLLSNYCDTNDVVVGCISNGRENNISFKNIIGFFSNIMTLRLKLESGMHLNEFILYVNKKIKEGILNQDYFYGEIVRDMNVHQDRNNKSLVQVIFNMQKSYDVKNQWAGIDKVRFNLNRNDKIIYDLIIDIKYNNEGVIIKSEYSSELFSDSLIKRFIQNYKYILENILTNINLPIAEIPCVDVKEQELILKTFNDTETHIKYENVFDILSESINNNFDRVAIIDDDKQLTYKEIKQYVNSLSLFLLNNRSEKEVIAILLTRSSLYVVSLLSVLSINAAFVPVDPNLPEVIKISILKGCNIKRIITSKIYKSVADDLKNKINEISILYVDDVEMGDVDYKMPLITYQDLAYIIFTSGTTGNPKGAMIKHGSLINLFYLFGKFFNLNNENRIIQFSNISFDASIWEIFMALYNGATLYIPTQTVILDTNEFCKYIEENQIDTMTLPPVYARQLVNYKLPSIKNLIVAGSVSYCEDYYNLKNKANFYNAYGLTETAVCATVFNMNNETCNIYNNEIPIGRPAPNTKLFILDKWNRIVPIGVIGELYVSGECLSDGYISNKLLTDEKFLSNKYFDNKKMYQTGDLAMWLEDGNVVVVGRNDEQIKIKGIRVELSAIESVYLKNEKIKQFAVIAAKNKNDYTLKAFYTADDNINEDDLRNYGENNLPRYMIPHLFIRIETIPTSHSGKIDKKALSRIDTTRNQAERNKDGSNNKTSIIDQIHKLISELTDQEFEHDDNFFEIGLDSYSLMLLRNKIKETLKIDIRVVELFKYTTISSLSKFLEKKLATNT